MEPRAALDIGSNTIRLLVAVPEDNALRSVYDQSEFVRLGQGVDRTGMLAAERIEAGIRAIHDLVDAAHLHGANDITAFATSAVRDAGNGTEFVERVRQETDIAVRILTGDEEARLTCEGATLGVALEQGAVVADLGGGSAELIAVDTSGIQWAHSLQLGSGRLTERFVSHDPPGDGELERLTQHVRDALRALPEARAGKAILTGGTATHITIVLGRTGTTVRLSEANMTAVLDELRRTPAADIVARYGIKPERAAVLPAGVCALAAIVQYYATPEIEITRHGIREGAILSSLR